MASPDGDCPVLPLQLTLLGVGAMSSPRYAPAGLLIEHRDSRVMIDGGPGGEPAGTLAAWLVTDEHSELIRDIRGLAETHSVRPAVDCYCAGELIIQPWPVVHTSHATYGYAIMAEDRRIVWAPEFWEFPTWAQGCELMFAEAAGWNRPIRFAKGVGGHMAALDVARAAQKAQIGRLVFAHIGRPTIRATDAGEKAPFGELGEDGDVYIPQEGRGWKRIPRDPRPSSTLIDNAREP